MVPPSVSVDPPLPGMAPLNEKLSEPLPDALIAEVPFKVNCRSVVVVGPVNIKVPPARMRLLRSHSRPGGW